VQVDFNISEWVRNGKPNTTFNGRAKDIANVITKNCPEVQFAPLPHLPGGEDLPLVGRADRTADDIYTIPDDKIGFYAVEGKTWTERSTGRSMMQGFIGLRTTIPLREIKMRKGVNEVLTKKNREIYMKMNNTSSMGTVPIGFLYNVHTSLPLFEDIGAEISKACNLNVDAHGRLEIEVTARQSRFGNCRAWFLSIAAASNNVDEIKRKIRNGISSIGGDKTEAMINRPMTHSACFVSHNS
jgi:hypothetical protein